MSPAQKIDKDKNLTDGEKSRRGELSKEFWGQKGAEVNMKNIFELMYLSFFIPSLGNRKLVKDDLEKLKPKIDAIGDQMIEIIKKSNG
jgi:hypothetical protein